MNCPKCGAKTKVVRTIHLTATTYRNRSCPKCGYVILSGESIIKDSITEKVHNATRKTT